MMIGIGTPKNQSSTERIILSYKDACAALTGGADDDQM